MSEVQLDLVRIMLCLFCLSYASLSDLKSREVSDIVWLIFAPIGLFLTLVSYYITKESLILVSMFLSLILVGGISSILALLEMLGSADVLGLIYISLSMPTFPNQTPIFLSKPIHPLFPLSTFLNGVLSSLASTFFILMKNIAWKVRKKESLFQGIEMKMSGKLLSLLIGYRTHISELENKPYLYPLEFAELNKGKLIRRMRFSAKVMDEKEKKRIVAELKELARKGAIPSEVWVSPGLPMIFFFMIGFVLSLAFGDVFSWMLVYSRLNPASTTVLFNLH